MESEDLKPKPERYSGVFGLALSQRQDAEDGVVYTRIGFVEFSDDTYILDLIHKIKRSRFTLAY